MIVLFLLRILFILFILFILLLLVYHQDAYGETFHPFGFISLIVILFRSIFPGAADAYLQVHITRQLADMLHSYFIVEQDRDLQADYVAISDVPDSNSAAAAPKSSSAGGIGSSGSYDSGNQTNGDGFGIATTKNFASGQGSDSGSWRLGAISGNLSRWLPSATRGLNLPRFMPRTAFVGNEQLDFVDRR
jgi:hypothetical protein